MLLFLFFSGQKPKTFSLHPTTSLVYEIPVLNLFIIKLYLKKAAWKKEQ